MPSKIAVVTDSSAYLPKEYVDQYGLYTPFPFPHLGRSGYIRMALTSMPQNSMNYAGHCQRITHHQSGDGK